MDIVINVAIVAAMLVGLVLLHELGHFVMARRAGVTVHEFGIGLPPRAAILYRGKETTYTLNWLPIGGFVRLEGEEGEHLDPRGFADQRLGTKLRILLAGVGMNLLLAWLIFTLISMFADPVYEVRVGAVVPGSPAASVGLTGSEVEGVDGSGDVITAIDGRRFAVFDGLTAGEGAGPRAAPLRYLDEHAGETVQLTVRRPGGRVEDITVTLSDVPQGSLGIMASRPLSQVDTTNGPVDAGVMGLRRTGEAAMLILGGVVGVLHSAVEGSAPPVSGPVGMTGIVDEVRTSLPPVYLVWLIGLLSANLAVVNALPLPPLDGGRAMMVLAQALSRGRLSPFVEQTVSVAGFVLLMVLLAWVTVADIQRPVG